MNKEEKESIKLEEITLEQILEYFDNGWLGQNEKTTEEIVRFAKLILKDDRNY